MYWQKDDANYYAPHGKKNMYIVFQTNWKKLSFIYNSFLSS